MSDKLIGPKVKIILSKFLPAIFMDAMRDNASASVHMFEGEEKTLSFLYTSRRVACTLARQSLARLFTEKQGTTLGLVVRDIYSFVTQFVSVKIA